MFTRTIRWCVLVLIVLVIGFSCRVGQKFGQGVKSVLGQVSERLEKWSKVEDLPPRALPVYAQLQEIPVPEGFVAVTEDSWFYTANELKIISVTYRGEMKLSLVEDFYNVEMQKRGWKLASVLGINYYKELYFEKKEARCSIRIEYYTARFKTKTKIMIVYSSSSY